jgi:hypothetical protein
MTAPSAKALKLQRPLPDGSLLIAAIGTPTSRASVQNLTRTPA